MEFSNTAALRATADDRVRRTPNARRLVTLYAVVPAVLSLVLTLLSYLLSVWIEDTGGLNGLGLRSVLETAQSILQLISVVFALFWSYGYIRASLCWTRGTQVRDGDLLYGFRRFAVILRAYLLQALVYFGLILLATQAAALVFSMTSLAEPMMTLIEQMMNDPSFSPTEEQLLSAMGSYLPFLLGTLVLFLAPLFYRVRLMELVLMDTPERGALFALCASVRLTRKNWRRLLRLDLSLWWYYLLMLLTTLLYYGDVALSLAGIDLGISAEAALAVACIAGTVAQVAVQIWKKNSVSTAYAVLFDELRSHTILPGDAAEPEKR